ncbi:MAG TPA: type II secretion system protein [Jatrophihabitantaceae bacterium]|jgi:type II secretory pathway pseudopilin PulG
MRQRMSDDSGETLLELIVSIAILGVCVVAIGAGIALSVKTSAIHRDQTNASAFLHNFAESIQSSYTSCAGATPPNYATALAPPSGFNPPTAAVRFWDAAAAQFSSATCPGTDPGLQQVTLTLTSTNGYVSESLVTVVRKMS